MTHPPVGHAKVTTPETQQAPTNPYFVQAAALAAANDKAGLSALDAYLSTAGYGPDGQVRAFIATSLA